MKGKIIKIVVLSLTFILAVMGFSAWMNRGEADVIVAMEEATYPTVSFTSHGYRMNPLVGYRKEMRIPAMRDTITPLEKDGSLSMEVQPYQMTIESAKAELYSLNGSQLLAEENLENQENVMQLTIGEKLPEAVEGVLCLTLYNQEGEAFYYYTRLVSCENYETKACLDFTKQLHENMLNKKENEVKSYLEPDETADNGTLHMVTIHSDVTQAMWGTLKPQVEGEITWEIKECNGTYHSILLRYKVQVEEEGIMTEHRVREFFKVRKLGNKYYLLTYERTMDQILSSVEQMVTVKGIDLGISGEDVSYQVSEDGQQVAFVRNGELWVFDRSEDTLSCVFTFAEEGDSRGEYDQHDIQIVKMEKDGNLIFMVYGYMNRGFHEGEVGVAIYKYHHAYSTIEEKVFLSSDKAYAVAAEELCKLVYYNEESNSIYLMMEEQLISKSLQDQTTKVLAEEMTADRYTVSDDGRYVAYQSGENGICMLDFATGRQQEILPTAGEWLMPLSYVENDLIVGYVREADQGKTLSGASITPMYQLKIYDGNNEVVKVYQENGIWVSDVFVADDMVTLKRVKKESGKYKGIKDDYVTNHEEQQEENVTLESYSTTLKQRQYRLAYANRIEDLKPRMRYPKQVLSNQTMELAMHSTPKENCYYVYGAGEMAGVFDQAGYAVEKADEIEGVVVSANQTYIWERGNYQGWYQIPGLIGRARKSKETTLSVCLKLLLAYEGKETSDLDKKEPLEILKEKGVGEPLDLTGCEAEDLRYIIGKGTPILAMRDSKNAYLLIGYQGSTIVYIDPADGKIKTHSMKVMDEMTEGSGHTYLGYAKPQEYQQ